MRGSAGASLSPPAFGGRTTVEGRVKGQNQERATPFHLIARHAARVLCIPGAPTPATGNPHHHPVVLWMWIPSSLGIGDPHVGDPSVTVQILPRILVGGSVLILIPRVNRAPETQILDQGQIRPVRVNT